MKQSLRVGVRGALSAVCIAMLMALTGCSNFFLCENKPACPASGDSTTGSNLAYVANGTSGSTYITGYTLSKSTLATATSSPYSLGITPTAMAVSRNNKFLYVSSTVSSSTGVAGIYALSIGTGGALSFVSSTAQVSLASVAAMDVSADGNWLIVASGIDGLNPVTVTAYALNTTSGAVTAETPVIYSVSAIAAVSALRVAPSGNYFAVALGTGGIAVFPFNTSTGAISAPSTISFSSTAVGAFDVAIDSANYLYIAATSNVYSFAVSSAGIPGGSAVSTTPTASGGPFALALDGTSYLYASALSGSSNLIYEFSTKAGVLTALSSTSIAAPTTTTKLAVDSTGAYLVAAGYDTSAGLRLYSISSAGILASLDTAATGTTTGVSTAVALGH